MGRLSVRSWVIYPAKFQELLEMENTRYHTGWKSQKAENKRSVCLRSSWTPVPTFILRN